MYSTERRLCRASSSLTPRWMESKQLSVSASNRRTCVNWTTQAEDEKQCCKYEDFTFWHFRLHKYLHDTSEPHCGLFTPQTQCNCRALLKLLFIRKLGSGGDITYNLTTQWEMIIWLLKRSTLTCRQQGEFLPFCHQCVAVVNFLWWLWNTPSLVPASTPQGFKRGMQLGRGSVRLINSTLHAGLWLAGLREVGIGCGKGFKDHLFMSKQLLFWCLLNLHVSRLKPDLEDCNTNLLLL